MKILLTGSSGVFGSEFVYVSSKNGCETYCIKHEELKNYNHQELTELFLGYDAVIHAAANTDLEFCELNPDCCYHDNYFLTEKIAIACKNSNVKMVYISSTGVYGDLVNRSHREYDEVLPLTHHHRSKLLGEISVCQHLDDFLVIRTGWLFGGPQDNKKNFVFNRINEANQSKILGNIIHCNNEQRGNPTYTRDLSFRIYELLERGDVGLFNCVNSGDATRYDYVQKIYQYANVDVMIEGVSQSYFNRISNPPLNEMAVNWKMNSMGMGPLRHWHEALRDYIEVLNG